jgi:hypothetical protein
MPFQRHRWIKWAAISIALMVVGFLIGLVTILFCGAPLGDQLNAAAAMLGGAIGAAGTAGAVYLTLAAQRRDEAEKVESTLRMEAAEFGRLAFGKYGVCDLILVDRREILVKDLPALMSMPKPVVYGATADRISRLPYGNLFVALHSRIAEAVSMAAMYAAAAPTPIFDGQLGPDPMVNEVTAKTLRTAWFDVCEIARSILRPDPGSHQIAGAVIAECLADLDAMHARGDPPVQPGA